MSIYATATTHFYQLWKARCAPNFTQQREPDYVYMNLVSVFLTLHECLDFLSARLNGFKPDLDALLSKAQSVRDDELIRCGRVMLEQPQDLREEFARHSAFSRIDVPRAIEILREEAARGQ